jgi:MoxR-like ATPase
MLHVKPLNPALLDRLLNSPRALRYRLPHLHDRAKQDLAARDTLAHQRTLLEIARVEREIDRQDAIMQKILETEKCQHQ